MTEALIRVTSELGGVVQGIGLRPALKRLADAAGLGGYVQNRSGTVRLVIEGSSADVDLFFARLPAGLPREADVDAIITVARETVSQTDGFAILDSGIDAKAQVMIPADLAVCEHCLAEVIDPRNRRYGYPFTTCTSCGPRYTVVERMPYDRSRTTLAGFPLCSDCLAEYEDPKDRRFHAESIACPTCGPRLRLMYNSERPVSGDPLRTAREGLARGNILAVRGIGGFQLSVNAFDQSAVMRLRQRKHRPEKPLAVMARDMPTIERHAETNDTVRSLLTCSSAPIVICTALQGATLPKAVNPGTDTIGMMLPTTPLHYLLFHPLRGDDIPSFDLLVMTSGNQSGEPICVSNDEAFDRLGAVADLFLIHDREITHRADDSVCTTAIGKRSQVWRRARGYAPRAIRTSKRMEQPVLALGNDFKNTIAVGDADRIVLSPHIGDLETPRNLSAFEDTVRQLISFLDITPRTVISDLHPDMKSTRFGASLSTDLGLPHMRIQHHHAHAAACMAEHGLKDALALVFDGTGLGEDGTIWGAELLHIEKSGYARLASFDAVPLPGGDAAVREPLRQLIARLWRAGLPVTGEMCDLWSIDEERLSTWISQCEKHLNAPLSSAAGRLFDAVACALGIAPAQNTYEGEPAIRLEALARRCSSRCGDAFLPFSAKVDAAGFVKIDWSEMFHYLKEKGADTKKDAIAWAFHRTVARAGTIMARHGREITSKSMMVLSGGVFMNRLLISQIEPMLADEGFDVRIHSVVPPNDGGLSLGQAALAGRIV